ncbi:hypothetical protein niasHS_008887 [Heterodera schachtii]|uniref:Uncharacterized protein n=1 Tax=Heterodera schachtii TaxID=97005 RepID=A0ABD2J328_HETSC
MATSAKFNYSQKQQPKKEGQEKGGLKITLPPSSESALGQDAVPTTSDSARATTAQAIIVTDQSITPPQIDDRKPNKCCFGFINQKTTRHSMKVVAIKEIKWKTNWHPRANIGPFGKLVKEMNVVSV